MEGQHKKVTQTSTNDTTEPTSSCGNYQIDFILSNHLILEHLVTYLTFADLKIASEVSRKFLQTIRITKQFNKKAVLFVSKESPDMEIILHNTNHTWLNVKIDFQLSPVVLNILPRVINSVESVAIVSTKHEKYKPIHSTEFINCFSLIMNSFPNLKHLQMDIRFLTWELNRTFQSPIVTERFKTLQTLDILSTHHQNPSDFRNFNAQLFLPLKRQLSIYDCTDCSLKSSWFFSNISYLAELPTQLESFKVAKVVIFGGFQGYENSITKPLLNILRNNRETLRQLSVHRDVWHSNKLQSMTFPLLTSLTVSIDRHGQENLRLFLKNHPNLQELCIENYYKLSYSLLITIQIHCTHLRKLHIKAEEFKDVPRGQIDWTFLKKMKHLQDFLIARPLMETTDLELYGTGPKFLASLPSNQLNSLTLKGLTTFPQIARMAAGRGLGIQGFWDPLALEIEQPELEFKKELLLNFKCLSKLSLIYCGHSVDDPLMQFIIKEFTVLQELELSHCYKLSDAGIFGTSTASWSNKLSISNLRGLKTLIIRSCPLVTRAQILAHLSLPFLKVLKVFDYQAGAGGFVSSSYVLELAARNPCLELIGVHVLYEATDDLQKKLYTQNPRLKLVRVTSGFEVEDFIDGSFRHEDPDRKD